MDRDLLFRRMEEKTGLTVCRAGSATLARLAVEAVRAGRHAAVAVRSRDALAVMRALTTLFTPELSVGLAAGHGPAPVVTPLWERPWVFLPPFSVRSLSREGWAERMSVLYALRTGTPKGVVFTLYNMIPLLPPPDFLDARAMTVRIGEDIAPELLMQQLVGYAMLVSAASFIFVVLSVLLPAMTHEQSQQCCGKIRMPVRELAAMAAGIVFSLLILAPLHEEAHVAVHEDIHADAPAAAGA